MAVEPPGSFNIEKLTRKVEQLSTDMGAVLSHLAFIRTTLTQLERNSSKMATQIEDMDAKLQNIADTETKLGTDIQTVVDALKAIPNPPQDLTAQLAKLDAIAQTLMDTDAQTLANLPPAPEPTPAGQRRR